MTPARLTHPLERLALYLLLLQSFGVSRFLSEQTAGMALSLSSSDIRLLILVSSAGLLLFTGSLRAYLPKPLLALVCLAVVSFLWSSSPPQTLQRALLLALFTVLYAILSARFSVSDMILSLRNALSLSIIIGLLLYFSNYPSVETFDWGSRNIIGRNGITGLFEHNVFSGVLCIINILLILRAPFTHLLTTVFSILASVSFLLLTDSSSALALATAAPMAVLFVRLRSLNDTRRSAYISAVSFASVAALLIIVNLDQISAILGRSADLSGRMPLWQSALSLIEIKPWLGWGYASVFGADGAMVRFGLELGEGNWEPPHFHNDFLQFWCEMGPLAAALFILSVRHPMKRRPFGDPSSDDVHTAQVVLLLVFAYSFTGEIFAAQKFGWLFLVFLAGRSDYIRSLDLRASKRRTYNASGAT